MYKPVSMRQQTRAVNHKMWGRVRAFPVGSEKASCGKRCWG